MTESKPLQTDAEKHSLPPATKFTRKKLLEVHAEEANDSFGWASFERVKELFSIASTQISVFVARYNLPVIRLSKNSGHLVSLPALQHILNNAPELLEEPETTPSQVLQALKDEAIEQVKAKYRADFEKTLTPVK